MHGGVSRSLKSASLPCRLMFMKLFECASALPLGSRRSASAALTMIFEEKSGSQSGALSNELCSLPGVGPPLAYIF